MQKAKQTPREQTKLPNNCWCSEISVTPRNWRSLKKIHGPWRIHYRFYDPTRPEPKQVTVKKMNRFTDIEARKSATEVLLDTEKQILGAGYNPFLNKVVAEVKNKYEISPNMLFIPALRVALGRKKMEPDTKKEIDRYIIGNVGKAAIHLNYHTLYISEVKKKHIVFILDHLRDVHPEFTDNTFNHFRKYLRILFKELVKVDAIEHNIMNDIEVIATEDKERETLTDEQRIYINDLLREKYPAFHRFLHIFFHSGGRIKELMRLRAEDVDIDRQRYKTTIKKGRKPRTVWRTIENNALLYWRELLNECQPGNYLFSKGLEPGPRSITSKQITRRWYSLVKKQFVYNNGRKGGKGKYVDRIHNINGKETIITADFYSLKHSHTTELIDEMERRHTRTEEAVKLAADHNGHTSTAMVVKIYDKKQAQRRHDRIKTSGVSFVK